MTGSESLLLLMSSRPYIRICVIWCAAALLSSCAPAVQQSGRMDVSTSVYIQPERPVDLSGKKLLIAPLALYTPQAHDWVPSVTGLVQNIFSQERVFRVIVRKTERFEAMDRLLDDAQAEGFDYVLMGSVPAVIFPAGNTSGWVGFDMRIIDTGSHVTLWHMYGQASLIPAPTRRSILGDGAHADAPSVSAGFSSIVRKMATIINCRALGRACASL